MTKYNTDILLNSNLKNQYGSMTRLSDSIAPLLGLSGIQTRRIIKGDARPNDRVKKEMIRLFNLSADDVKTIGWNKKKKVETSSYRDKYKLDVEKIEAMLKERGMSASELMRTLGMSSSLFGQWKGGYNFPSEKSLNKVCNFFSIKPSDVLISKDGSSGVENDALVAPLPLISGESKKNLFEIIGDEKDIFKIFNLINKNIITLAGEMDKCMRLQEDRFNNLTAKISVLEEKLDKLNAEQVDKEPVVTIIKPKAIVKKTEQEEKPVEDTFDYYRHQINQYVNEIINKSKSYCTFKQILSKHYDILKNVYGAVMCDLEKAYVEDRGHKARSTMEYIWFNPIYREIFFNNVKDEAENNEEGKQ